MRLGESTYCITVWKEWCSKRSRPKVSIWMIFLRPKYSQFPYKVSRETGDENCVCDVTVFDNIAVAGSRLVISLAHGFKGAVICLLVTLIFDPSHVSNVSLRFQPYGFVYQTQ